MNRRSPAVCILVVLFASHVSSDIGRCNLSTPPTSWLTTSAIGIPNWAHAGVPLGGDNYCIEGNKTAEIIEIAYHANVPDASKLQTLSRPHPKTIMQDNPNNGCVVKDDRIQYCFAFCETSQQTKVIHSALLSSSPFAVADILAAEVAPPGWAVTVLTVDYNNPLTHLNVSLFIDPAVWCSVYIGIEPKVGFPYLYEVQLVNVIP